MLVCGSLTFWCKVSHSPVSVLSQSGVFPPVSSHQTRENLDSLGRKLGKGSLGPWVVLVSPLGKDDETAILALTVLKFRLY